MTKRGWDSHQRFSAFFFLLGREPGTGRWGWCGHGSHLLLSYRDLFGGRNYETGGLAGSSKHLHIGMWAIISMYLFLLWVLGDVGTENWTW